MRFCSTSPLVTIIADSWMIDIPNLSSGAGTFRRIVLIVCARTKTSKEMVRLVVYSCVLDVTACGGRGSCPDTFAGGSAFGLGLIGSCSLSFAPPASSFPSCCSDGVLGESFEWKTHSIIPSLIYFALLSFFSCSMFRLECSVSALREYVRQLATPCSASKHSIFHQGQTERKHVMRWTGANVYFVSIYNQWKSLNRFVFPPSIHFVSLFSTED